MKELPILFSTPMVQALLEGRKTQTRRILKNIPRISDNVERTGQLLSKSQTLREAFCPYGEPDDRLWVREKFVISGLMWQAKPSLAIKYCSQSAVKYAASDNDWQHAWRPSIHMPKEAARIWLQVEEVRVERLHDISEEDILAEGVRIPVNGPNNVLFELGKDNSAFSFLPEIKEGEKYTQHQILFAFWAELWCKINGRKSWDANPWLWVIKFKKLQNQ